MSALPWEIFTTPIRFHVSHKKQQNRYQPYSIDSTGPAQPAQSGNLCVGFIRDKDISVHVPVNMCCPVASPVLSVTDTRQSQKKDIRPSLNSHKEIKCVKSASVVGHCVFAPPVSNVSNVAHVQLVGGCLQNFW